MATITIDPPEAIGCSASTEVAGNEHSSTSYYEENYNLIRLIAKAKTGWEFKRFEWDVNFSWMGPYTGLTAFPFECSKREDGSFVFPPDGESTTSTKFRNLKDGGYRYFGDYEFLGEGTQTIAAKAIFEKKEGSGKILHNKVGLILHGSNGTILYDD